MGILSLLGLAVTLIVPPLQALELANTGTDQAQEQEKEQKQESKKKQKEDKTSKGRVTFTLAKHPVLSVGSSLKLEFDARIEANARLATPAIGLDTAQFGWQHPSFGVTGTAWKKIRFELSRDPTEGDPRTPLKDAYIDLRIVRALELEGGRFKLPFGLEALTGRKNLNFVHRSLVATQLSPGRDIGIMAHGRVWGRGLEYAAGYFARDGDNSRTGQTAGAGPTVAGRVVLTPFVRTTAHALASLAVGVAGARSDLDHQLGLRGESVFDDGVFFDRVYVNGLRHRIGLDALWASGPVSLSTEYVVVADERKAMGFAGENLPGVRAHGWYIAGTWALTGEPKDGRLTPRHSLLQGGWGAVELAARIEGLAFDSISHPGTAFGFPDTSKLLSNANRVTTLGINWYLNAYLKVQPNLVIESISDPNRSPAPTAAGRFLSGVFSIQFVL